MENSRKIFIPVRELIEIFSRASGRGGQNVNKVETKVELHGMSTLRWLLATRRKKEFTRF